MTVNHDVLNTREMVRVCVVGIVQYSLVVGAVIALLQVTGLAGSFAGFAYN